MQKNVNYINDSTLPFNLNHKVEFKKRPAFCKIKQFSWNKLQFCNVFSCLLKKKKKIKSYLFILKTKTGGKIQVAMCYLFMAMHLSNWTDLNPSAKICWYIIMPYISHNLLISPL